MRCKALASQAVRHQGGAHAAYVGERGLPDKYLKQQLQPTVRPTRFRQSLWHKKTSWDDPAVLQESLHLQMALLDFATPRGLQRHLRAHWDPVKHYIKKCYIP